MQGVLIDQNVQAMKPENIDDESQLSGCAERCAAQGGAVPATRYWWPRRGESTWPEYASIASLLAQALRPQTFVLLGAAQGVALCGWREIQELAHAHFAAVEQWAARSFGGVPGAQARRELEAHLGTSAGAATKLLDADVLDAAAGFPDRSIDLLHIDGVHAAAHGSRLLDAWLPKLSAHGVVFISDLHSGRAGEGVQALWATLAARYPNLAFEHGAGCGFAAVGDALPAALRSLLSLSALERARLQAHHAQLAGLATHSEMQARLWALEAALAEAHAEAERARAAERAAREDLAANQESLDLLADDLEGERSALRATQESLQSAYDDVAALRRSTSWRLTAPLRVVVMSLRTPRMIVARARHARAVVRTSVREQGWPATLRKIATAPSRHGLRGLLGASAPAGSLDPVFDLPLAPPARERLAMRVLIVAEMSIPQCRKYRVTQKQQMILKLGIECTAVSWNDTQAVRSLLQTHSIVIFYRVPAFPQPLRLIREAKAMGLVTFWEVDDLIFDASKYAGNSNIADLDDEARRGILEGVELYRTAMLACDYGIASTEGLARAMHEAGVPQVSVVENALDTETVRAARGLDGIPKRADGIVRIVYGSGTRTHDADFRVAATALRRVLKARPNACFVVIGELNLPAEFNDIQAQVQRLPLSDYRTYLKRLAACDISIAPLEDSVFNDAKSNIKFLEASIVRLPSVCSPSAAFRTAITEGDTGYLAADTAAWERALLALIDDAALRERMAARAHDYVSKHYAPTTVAYEQVLPILAPYAAREKNLRVLGVNIYFEPRSFGGATIVAEEVARRLNQRDDIEYAMFTSLPTSDVPAYKLVRYRAASGGDVFAMGLPPEGNPNFEFENPNSIEAFAEAVSALRPDVVHLHSIQGIGAQIAEVCLRERIPYVVTAHDAWWICGRQFMITGEHVYCNQRKIDLNVCATCVKDPSLNSYRQFRLREILFGAARLITPSEFFRELFTENGFDPTRIVVNKNGVVAPRRAIRRESLARRPLRIGYVGGETPIKGAPLLRKVLRSLPARNYELRVVDNVLNLGRRSIDAAEWRVPGTLKIVPAYTQETIDDFFEGIDVLVTPTQCKESFGLSVREALIRDVWVVTTDAGGAVEDIVDGENGNIVPLDDDGTDLGAALGDLLENPLRLEGYRNPHVGRVRIFDEQARELHALLAEVAAEAPRAAVCAGAG